VKISAKAEYACLAIITLAQRRSEEKPVTIREIAKSHRIPESFLNRILLKLKGAGIVQSTRGSSGGYRLARPPEQIKLDEVLKIIDGCAFAEREPQGPAAHVLAEVWNQIRTSKVGILSGTSVAQLAERINPHDWVI
jgi:Rrf2 family protein